MEKPDEAKDAIASLVIAALNVQDAELTDWQRHLADQIYGLANALEVGQDESGDSL